MESQQLHRGRLIDHIQLVVRDVSVSRRFYEAVMATLGIAIGGEGDDYFWVDELFVSSAQSDAAQGELTGRHHLAFQASDRATVDAFFKTALENGGLNRPGFAGGHCIVEPQVKLIRKNAWGSFAEA
jgi:catechol 2,3-dioxygenase-like lactoylglutathione lyase family enzyme